MLGIILGMEDAKINKTHLCPQSVHKLVKIQNINRELVCNDRRGFYIRDNGTIKVHEGEYCNFISQILNTDLNHLDYIFYF